MNFLVSCKPVLSLYLLIHRTILHFHDKWYIAVLGCCVDIFDMMRNRPKVSASSDPVEDIESADSSSEVLKGLDLTIRSSQQKHVPIYNKDRKYTPCLYCGRLKNRTRSGWRVNTFYRCLQCDVPLCVNDRNCFVLYHKYFLGMTNVENPGRRRSRDTGQVEVKKETNG